MFECMRLIHGLKFDQTWEPSLAVVVCRPRHSGGSHQQVDITVSGGLGKHQNPITPANNNTKTRSLRPVITSERIGDVWTMCHHWRRPIGKPGGWQQQWETGFYKHNAGLRQVMTWVNIVVEWTEVCSTPRGAAGVCSTPRGEAGWTDGVKDKVTN